MRQCVVWCNVMSSVTLSDSLHPVSSAAAENYPAGGSSPSRDYNQSHSDGVVTEILRAFQHNLHLNINMSDWLNGRGD